MKIIKNIVLNITLLAVFAIPQLIRTHHIFTVQHNIQFYEQKYEHIKLSIHNLVEHCPIHEYNFNIPDKVADTLLLCKPTLYTTPILSYFTKKEKYNHLFFFNLRAPPCQLI